jgi:hypothetical protein
MNGERTVSAFSGMVWCKNVCKIIKNQCNKPEAKTPQKILNWSKIADFVVLSILFIENLQLCSLFIGATACY